MNGYEILAVIVSPDLEDLYKFLTHKIAPMAGVLNMETLVRAELIKSTYLSLDPEELIL